MDARTGVSQFYNIYKVHKNLITFFYFALQLTQEDRHFAHWLRVNLPEPPATTAAVHIVVNKSEKFDVLDSMDER